MAKPVARDISEMPAARGQLRRLRTRQTSKVTVHFDGLPIEAQDGDSLLCAILSRMPHLRQHEFDGGVRSGFCCMGVCQDCWVWLEGGHRVRACTTAVEEGVRVTTVNPALGAGYE